MQYIVYYEKSRGTILDHFPASISHETQELIKKYWGQPVCREILKFLSKQEETTAPEIQEAIGHSMSTLHENITRLEADGLIMTEMVYKQNKKKIIRPNVMFVNKNSPLTERITRFLNQGLLVDTATSRKIIKFLDKHPDKAFSAEQISVKTGIQVDEIETLLNNWDSIVTRAFSEALRKKPFVKRVTYQSSKGKNVDFRF